MATTFDRFRSPPLWAKCLLASAVLHSAILYVAFRHPLFLEQSFAPLFTRTKPNPTFVDADKDWVPDQFVLEHFFEEIPTIKPQIESSDDFSLTPSKEAEEEIQIALSPSKLLRELSNLFKNESKAHSISISEEDNLPPFAIPVLAEGPNLEKPDSLPFYETAHLQQSFLESTLLANEFVIDFIAPILKKPYPEFQTKLRHFSLTPTLPTEAPYAHAKRPELPSMQDPFSSDLAKEPSLAFHPSVHLELLTEASFANVEEYLSEELLSVTEWDRDFHIKTSFFPDKDAYVFALVLEPTEKIHEKKIPQNFYFVIDISSQIEKHKLSVFKRSVLKTLSSLQQGDMFNILFVDKHITKLSPKMLTVSPQSLHLAEEFLENATDRSLFSSLNLYEHLKQLLNLADDTEELHTAILFTNGKTSLDTKELRQLVNLNQKKLNLFTAAVGQNNNLVSLDLTSSLLGGKLVYSDTNAGFPRKLSQFIKTLANPIAKDISVTVIPSNPKASIELALPLQQPNLYSKEPFIIMGTIDRLCDLDLIIEGKSASDRVFFKKKVLFEESSSSQPFKKEWAIQEKGFLYGKFLKEMKPIYLQEAKELLKTAYGKAFPE
jgi:hypothetical protein